jgi:hypothetical protein
MDQGKEGGKCGDHALALGEVEEKARGGCIDHYAE